MTDCEAIAILARWVYKLQVDLLLARAELAIVETQVDDLKTAVRGYSFWVQSGLTPADIVTAGAELDPAT